MTPMDITQPSAMMTAVQWNIPIPVSGLKKILCFKMITLLKDFQVQKHQMVSMYTPRERNIFGVIIQSQQKCFKAVLVPFPDHNQVINVVFATHKFSGAIMKDGLLPKCHKSATLGGKLCPNGNTHDLKEKLLIVPKIILVKAKFQAL